MRPVRIGGPTPITPAQFRALVRAIARETTWGLAEVRREVAELRKRAESIADPALRRDALLALKRKRPHIDGAALFAILPRRRHADLVSLLVAYETILDFLDEVSERHPTEANGRELHMALIDALLPERQIADYYRHHLERCDSGYLEALVERCRRLCRTLPSFDEVRGDLTREIWRTQVLGLNHVVPARRRDDLLREWAHDEFSDDERCLDWFELSAAASASLVIHSLLALASEPGVTAQDVSDIRSAYWPWTSLATAMLDSYVDIDEDRESGNHSYIAHYDERCGIDRLCECIRRAATRTTELPNGRRHAVILSAMIAMYLSKDSAQTPIRRAVTRQILRAGGALPRLLLPLARAWRTVYALRSA